MSLGMHLSVPSTTSVARPHFVFTAFLRLGVSDRSRWLVVLVLLHLLNLGCSRGKEPRNEELPPEAQTNSTTSTGVNMTRTSKDDATDLMNMLLPFAEKMLKEHGEFYPYGGAMLPDGTMTMLGASDGAEHPPSKNLIELMESSFREAARQGKYKATGMVYDVKTIPPGAVEKMDAIAVRLDHQDGYSVVVMIPYRLGPGGEVMKGTLFANKGAASIFPAAN